MTLGNRTDFNFDRFIVQQCLLYSSVYCTAVFIVLQCLLYSSVYCTAVFIVQQCLLYSSVYCTAVFIIQQCLFTKIFLNTLIKCNNPFHCTLQFNNMVLRKILCRKMETLIGRWRTFQKTLEDEIFGACEVFRRNEIMQKFLSANLKAVCCQRIKE